MSDELKPCPCCGGEAILRRHSHREFSPNFSVQCQYCRLSTTTYKIEAIAADDLATLAKARDEGRVVALPCKVGDTVWNIKFVFSYYSEPKEEVVDRFVISRDGVDAVFKSGYKFSIERFGKTVFLTRAEAEAALKGAIENGQ